MSISLEGKIHGSFPFLIHAPVGNRPLGRAEDAIAVMSIAGMMKTHSTNDDLRSRARGNLTPLFGKNRNESEIKNDPILRYLDDREKKNASPIPAQMFGSKRDKTPSSSTGNRKGRAQTPMPRVGDTLLFGKDSQSLRRKSDDNSRISEGAERVKDETKKTRIMSPMEPGEEDHEAEPKWIRKSQEAAAAVTKGTPTMIDTTTRSRLIEVKPADTQPTSLGIGVTLWLHKFIKNTRTVNGNQLKDIDIDVEVTKNDIEVSEPAADKATAAGSQPTPSPAPSSGLPVTGTKARRAASSKEGHNAMTAGNWSDLRSRLIQAKVQDAFQSAKFAVNGVTYTSLSHIGEGGYSTVYEVFNKERELFALKVVKPHESNSTVWSDLLKEIDFLTELRSCKHVVKLVDHERVEIEREEALYILMERGECDLSHILSKLDRDERLTPSKIRFYWEQMLEAVQAVHGHGIVHADIKPPNFILVQGQLKLIDFGFAAKVPEGGEALERDFVGGTKEYFSPESMSHYVITDGAVDAVEMKRRDSRIKIGFKSDVWALGVILFQLTYGGSTPFAQVPGGKVARIQALISLEHEVDFEPIGDAHLLDTMKLCLMKDPANRATVARLLKHPFLRPC